MIDFKEIRVKDIPWISHIKGTSTNFYLGPELTQEERSILSEYPNTYLYYYFGDKDFITQEKISYTYPGLNLPNPFTAETVFQAVRDSIKASTGVIVDPQSKCIIRHEDDSFVVFIGDNTLEYAIAYLDHKGQSYAALRKAAEEERKRREAESEIRFRVTSDESSDDDGIRYRRASKPIIQFSIGPAPKKKVDNFDEEMTKAAEEVKKAIGDLLLKGFSASLIQSWITEQVKLSRLRITRQFKIFMVDYDLEIKMGPLPKTIFLFYLRHPEGVRFSYLQDYVNELIHIYERVSVNDDPERMRDSIMALTNPLNNSINEKCAAIKKAFLMQVNDDVARNYYVTGLQGGTKGITLDRNLVEWECEL